MARRPAPESTLVLDQLLAALVESGSFPLSTDDLASKTGPKTDRWRCYGGEHHLHHGEYPGSNTISETCSDGMVTLVRNRYGQDVYRFLRMLEDRGECRRVRVDGHTKIYWAYTGKPPDLTDLEAVWAMPAAERAS